MGCELKLNGFFLCDFLIDLEINGTSFVRVEIYARIYNITCLATAIYNITRLFTAICSKLMGFSLMAARSWVYIRVPYSADTPVSIFDPLLQSTTTVYLGYLLC